MKFATCNKVLLSILAFIIFCLFLGAINAPEPEKAIDAIFPLVAMLIMIFSLILYGQLRLLRIARKEERFIKEEWNRYWAEPHGKGVHHGNACRILNEWLKKEERAGVNREKINSIKAQFLAKLDENVDKAIPLNCIEDYDEIACSTTNKLG